MNKWLDKGCSFFQKFFPRVVDGLIHIGQAQLLRKMINHEILFNCRMDANLYLMSLENLNRAVLREIRSYNRNPENEREATSQTSSGGSSGENGNGNSGVGGNYPSILSLVSTLSILSTPSAFIYIYIYQH